MTLVQKTKQEGSSDVREGPLKVGEWVANIGHVQGRKSSQSRLIPHHRIQLLQSWLSRTSVAKLVSENRDTVPYTEKVPNVYACTCTHKVREGPATENQNSLSKSS